MNIDINDIAKGMIELIEDNHFEDLIWYAIDEDIQENKIKPVQALETNDIKLLKGHIESLTTDNLQYTAARVAMLYEIEREWAETLVYEVNDIESAYYLYILSTKNSSSSYQWLNKVVEKFKNNNEFNKDYVNMWVERIKEDIENVETECIRDD